MRQEQKGGYVLQEARILKQKAIQIFFFFNTATQSSQSSVYLQLA